MLFIWMMIYLSKKFVKKMIQIAMLDSLFNRLSCRILGLTCCHAEFISASVFRHGRHLDSESDWAVNYEDSETKRAVNSSSSEWRRCKVGIATQQFETDNRKVQNDALIRRIKICRTIENFIFWYVRCRQKICTGGFQSKN